jgi:hypothetical protein
VELGVDLATMKTVGDLQGGLEEAEGLLRHGHTVDTGGDNHEP